MRAKMNDGREISGNLAPPCPWELKFPLISATNRARSRYRQRTKNGKAAGKGVLEGLQHGQYHARGRKRKFPATRKGNMTIEDLLRDDS